VTKLEHLPALDGLRGACLLAVLLFHSGYAWMSGGFLGVSTFFTLSGYLITTLLVVERDATGTVSLRRFWERRLRRLLPAALVTIVAIVATAPLWMPPAQRENLAEEALGTLFYVVNWRFMSPEYAYGLIFTDPSPFQHFWSLAIEGQFYLLFPLLVGVVVKSGGGTRALAVLCALLALASLAVAFGGTSLADAQHRLYYGTDARAEELLIGALLALAQQSGGRAAAVLSGAAIRSAGPLAAVLMLVAWSRASVEDAWLYRGGLAAYALLSAIAVAAATQPTGPVRRALGAAWLRWIGRVSYGAYLFHWPIFLFLTEARTGLGEPALLVVRLAATFGLAALSYRWLELPVRRTALLPGRRFALTSVVATLVVATLVIASNPTAIALWTLATIYETRQRLAGEVPNSQRVRFAMFGDSTAMTLWTGGLGGWIRNDGQSLGVTGSVKLGCGLFAFGEIENRDQWNAERAECHDLAEQWRASVAQVRPDVAIVLVGPWEARNRRRSPTAPSLHLGDPELDAATRRAIEQAVDALTSSGAVVVWLASPYIQIGPLKGETFRTDAESSDPKRMDLFNAMLADVARTRTDRMRIVDLGAYLQRRPGGLFDPAIRADGVHFTKSGAAEVSADWLGPEILRAARELLDAREAVRQGR